MQYEKRGNKSWREERGGAKMNKKMALALGLSALILVPMVRADIYDHEPFYKKGDPEYRSLAHLDKFLNSYIWSEDSYQRGKWDCGDMSAYIFNRLKREGFTHTDIACGKAPWDPESGGYHAWIIVKPLDCEEKAIEPTLFCRVDDNEATLPFADAYFNYQSRYSQLYQARGEWAPGEFNWRWFEIDPPIYVGDDESE